jgi:thiosulfate dehydrogenase
MTTRTRPIRAAGLGPLLVATALAGCADPDPIIVQGTAVEHGAALFEDAKVAGGTYNSYSCATCHATARPAPGSSGPILPGAPLAGATKRPSFWGGTELDLLRSVNHCLYYFMLSDEAWSPEVDEAQAMYAYLDSLPARPEDEKPVPFSVVVQIEDLPPGDVARGEKTYDRACRSCHGAKQTGAGRLVPRAPALPDQTLAEHPPDQYTAEERRLVFIQKTRHGGFLGYGGQMPPFSREVLPDADLSDVLSFLGVDF